MKVEKIILLHFIRETCYGCERLISMRSFKRSFKKRLKKINFEISHKQGFIRIKAITVQKGYPTLVKVVWLLEAFYYGFDLLQVNET